MKKEFMYLVMLLWALPVFGRQESLSGPNKALKVNIDLKNGAPYYSVEYNGKIFLEDSPLGLVANIGDFSREMTFIESKETPVEYIYTQNRIKRFENHYKANELICTYANKEGKKIDIIFRVSNNDIAFRYRMPQYGETACCVIEREATGFDFPQHTTTFLTPQSTPMIGWKRTKPSYEEEYVLDEPLGTPSKYGYGYTFPGLFHIGDDGWVLVSETGVSSLYCGSRLSEGTKEGLYRLTFPDPKENNGIGTATAGLALPGETPWRTLTVGDNLRPIVETTIPFDLTEPLYEPSEDYKFGRGTWSWIMWQDRSINYDDQIRYIDLAATLGFEFVLIDNWWDTKIGRDRIPDLVKYANSKSVDVCLWYNSNGYWSDAPQGPKQYMSNSVARNKEMKWLKSVGVKGLKVDFFGGDKQETMKLYEDILVDANEYGLTIIFHGCTLPRGWERMYPNYVGSEAVLASENLIFTQHANDREAYNACLHPFIRNTVGIMEFGPVLLNKRHNRTNDGGTRRVTTDIFQLATAVLFQSPVQMFALAPNNLTDVPAFELDFMRKVPTTWNDIYFIDGYPGKYCVLARCHQDKWYVVGINAQEEAITIKVALPMFAGRTVTQYVDDKKREPQMKEASIGTNGEVELTILSGGGVIFTDN